MANLFFLPYRPAYDNAGGLVVPGAQIYFTNTGGTVKPIYSDSGLTIPRTNPVVADGVGKLPTGIYMDPAITYRVRIYGRGATVGVDTPLQDFNPYVPGVFADAAALQPVADAAAASASAASDSASGAATSATAAAASATAAATSSASAALAAAETGVAEAAIIAALAAGGSVSLAQLEASGISISPLWLGAVGDGVTDDHAALQAWLDLGGDLILPNKRFRSSQKLYVRRNCRIRGAQPLGLDSRITAPGYENLPGSRIVFDAGVAGLDVQTSTTMLVPADVVAAGAAAWNQEGAFNCVIEDIGIIGSGGATAHGITVRTVSHFRNVRVCAFSGRGWDVDASSFGTDGNDYGDLSNSEFLHCTAESNGGNGLHFRGIDANTCTVIGFNAHLNGGWGIYVESFFGQLFDKPHMATNTLGAFKTVGTATNTIIQAYVETGTGANVDIGDNNIILGDLRSLNLVANNPTTVGAEIVQVDEVQAKGIGVPLTVNSTNSNGPKIALKNNGTAQAYIGGEGAGVDYTVWNSDGTVAFRVYSVANGRRFEPIGAIWGSTASARLASTTGWQALYDATKGGVFSGGGSSYDVTIQNKSGTDVARVPTGTANWEFLGSATATAGIVGYATGAGGAVTQTTSKATAVTLNKLTGEITLNGASLAAGTVVSFTHNNSFAAAGQLVVGNHVSGGTIGAYTIVGVAAAGTITWYIRNNTAGALAEAAVIRFGLYGGATS